MNKSLNFASLMVLLVMLTGCGNSNDSTEIVVVGEDSSNLTAIATEVANFSEKTGIDVVVDKSSFEASYEKSLQDLVNQSGLYDVILQYNFSLSSFVLNDWVYTIEELAGMDESNNVRAFEKDLFKNAWKEVGFFRRPDSKDEVVVGYPFASNTMLLAYNKELFESRDSQKRFSSKYGRKLAVPKTWKELYEVAEFFSDDAAGTKGIVMHGASSGWLYYEWANMAFGMGGGVMDKQRGWEGDLSTELLITSPETMQATELFMSLKPFNKGDFFSTAGTEQREIFQKGKVAMAFMWSDYVYPITIGEHAGKFGFAPIPGNRSGLAGGAFFVNKKSKAPKAAFEFINYIMSPEIQKELVKRGLCSALRSVYEDPKIIRTVPYAEALKISLDRGVYFWEAGPDADAIQQILTNYLQQIWREEISVEEGLSAADREIRKARQEIFSAN